MNRGGIVDFSLLRTISAICLESRESSFLEVIDFYFISICKFDRFKKPFAIITSFLNFTLDSHDLFCWYRWKKWFLWTMAAAQMGENHRAEWGLRWYLQWGIYTSIPTWNHSHNSLVAAEAPSLKIPFYGISIKWSWKLNHNLGNETRLPIWHKVNGNWDNMIRITHWK